MDVGAVKVQASTPFAVLELGVQPIIVSCERQESPPFVCESRAAKVMDGVFTVVVQSTVKSPFASAKNCMLPQGGLPGPPPLTLTRASRPSARTTLDVKIMTAATVISLKAFKCAPPCDFRRFVPSIRSTKPSRLSSSRVNHLFSIQLALTIRIGSVMAMCNVFDQLGNGCYFQVIPALP